MSFASTSTSTVSPSVVTPASATATGVMATETVPVSQAGVDASSQPSIVNVSRPVQVPVGV